MNQWNHRSIFWKDMLGSFFQISQNLSRASKNSSAPNISRGPQNIDTIFCVHMKSKSLKILIILNFVREGGSGEKKNTLIPKFHLIKKFPDLLIFFLFTSWGTIVRIKNQRKN